MSVNRRKHGCGEALQAVLMAMIDPINQLFFHSRMLRAWGHPRGMDYNDFWLSQMRRATSLVEVMAGCDIRPCDRPPCDIVIGRDVRAIFTADADQSSRFVSIAADAADVSSDRDVGEVLIEIVRAEQAHHERLRAWLSGPEADERPSNAKHLGPKPGGAPVAVAAINRVLPHMTAAVSQVFFHSLMFGGDGEATLARRELDASLAMMYRTEALLERLLDLGGYPSGKGHGLIRIGAGPGGAERTALEAHARIIAELEPALESLDGLTDPMTHTLIEGILRAERQELQAIELRRDSADRF